MNTLYLVVTLLPCAVSVTFRGHLASCQLIAHFCLPYVPSLRNAPLRCRSTQMPPRGIYSDVTLPYVPSLRSAFEVEDMRIVAPRCSHLSRYMHYII